MSQLRVLGLLGCVIGILAATLGASGISRAADAKTEVSPIVFKDGAQVTRDFDRKQRAWCERVLVAPFLKRAEGKPWATKAVDFVSRAVDGWSSSQLKAYARELSEEGNGLIAGGCDDPLVRYLATWMDWYFTGEWHAARRGFRDIYEKTDKFTDAEAVKWLLLLDFIQSSSVGNRDTEAAGATIPVVLKDLFARGIYGKEDATVLVRHLGGDRWYDVRKRYFREITRGIEQAPIETWASEAIQGCAAVSAAWASRGSGWASTVKPEGWEGFEKALLKAREHLVRSWELNAKDPVAATAMIVVTMGGVGESGENERTWFDRATAAEFDYFDAYCSIANAYLPRWSGSHELMISFAKACVATGRFDTDAPLGFFAILWNLDRDAEDLRKVYRDLRIRETLLQVSKALAADPVRAPEKRARYGLLAVYAWIAGDYELAQSALSTAGSAPLLYLQRTKLRDAKTDENRFRAAVEAYNSPLGRDLEVADQVLAEGDSSRAIQMYEAALKSVRPAGRKYVEAQLAVARFEQAYAKGDWVEVPPSSDLLSWVSETGNWESRNGLPSSSKDHGPTRIFFGGKVGPAFELEGTVSISGGPRENLCGGLAFAPRYHSGGRECWYGCQAFIDSDAGMRPHAMFTERDGVPRTSPPVECEIRTENEFRIKVQNQRVSWDLNGKPMQKDIPLDDEMDEGSLVGVGSFSHHPGITETLTKLRVKKL